MPKPSRFLIRCIVILFWVALIFSILYSPKWKIIPVHGKQINVFAWGDILDPEIIKQFEKQSGITVVVNYYSSNEELLVKLKATQGEGYDLIIPSDYAVQLLSKENLLKEIDKSKLDFWQHLNPSLLGHFFDPQNRFSIPFEWEIYGLGINKNYFATRTLDPSWKLIFAPPYPYKIAMINDPIEAILFASFFLYGDVKKLSSPQVEEVTSLLIRQKQWVEAYANFRGDYFLATNNCPVVIASSSYLWRTKRQFPFAGVVIPKEGTYITIENISIPKASRKEDFVYSFINFLFTPESVAAHYELYGFFPSTTHALEMLQLDEQANQLVRSSKEDFKNFHFTHVLLPQEQLRDIWVDIKTSSE